jgi:hypothetical protein
MHLDGTYMMQYFTYGSILPKLDIDCMCYFDNMLTVVMLSIVIITRRVNMKCSPMTAR